MNAAPAITLGALRKAGKAIERESGQSLVVECHPGIEADVRALPNFVPAEKYHLSNPGEIGAVELFRFFRESAQPVGTWRVVGPKRLEREAVRADAALAEALRHISKLTSFYMDNVLWGQACEKARAFAEKMGSTAVAAPLTPDRPSPPATQNAAPKARDGLDSVAVPRFTTPQPETRGGGRVRHLHRGERMSTPKVPIVYNATGATIADAYIRLVAYLEEQGRADLIGAIAVHPKIYPHEGAERHAWAATELPDLTAQTLKLTGWTGLPEAVGASV